MIFVFWKYGINWEGGARRAVPHPHQCACQYVLQTKIIVSASYRDPLDKAICVPMSSPETMSSTRRLRCRPAAVSFVATGCDLPNPLAGDRVHLRNPLLDEIVAHRSGSLFREVLVVRLTTHAIGMAFDLQL